MKNPRPDPLPDPWWDTLAAWLGTPGGLRTARRLQQDGFFDPAEAPRVNNPPIDGPQPISIWQPRMIDGALVFERPDPLAMGDHYAVRKRIPARKDPGTKRVCFFGESVAAGYLYAPHCTPAQVLRHQLQAIRGSAGFEVIDLARTNETLAGLATTVAQAMQLQPDALIIFAGNNWTLLETPYASPYAPSVRARQDYAAVLRAAGLAGPIERAARKVLHRAAATLAHIDQVARAAAIPVVLIIPEVNLADWETRQPVPWLPGDATARWYRLYDDTLDRLDKADWVGAIEAAQALVDLDGALCPSSFRLLAKAYAGAGDAAQARTACRAEVEANQYASLCFLGAPQASRMAQEVQRRAAQHHGFATVDLPEVFAAYTGGALPGRRLFLDYCHLTIEGMHVAMAATTAEILRLFGEEEGDAQALVQQIAPPSVAPEVDATAKFGAAIHTAHRLTSVGPRGPLLTFWCRVALEASPGIVQAMLDLVAVRTAHGSAVLTAAQQRNYASPYRLTFQHGWHYEYLDADMIEAIYAVVDPPEQAQIRQRLRAHRLPLEGVDLIYPLCYLKEPLEQFYPDVMPYEDLPQRAFYRAPWPVSTFCFIDDATRDVELAFTARLPTMAEEAPPEEAEVGITVNGIPAGVITVDARWSAAALRIEHRMLHDGLNHLALRWPMPSVPGGVALEAAIARLELGLEADLHPVFGEVFSLIARPC